MLKYVRLILVTLFVLALGGSVAVFLYNYTHEDNSPPAFQCDMELIEVSVTDPEEALLQGLHAYDNVDGDISDRIQVKEISTLINDKDVTVSYIVFDDASNYAVYSRTARYTDYAPPRFHLSKPMIFKVGEAISFRDSVTVKDLREGDISGRVKLEESTVLNSTPGTYSVRLSATNRMGDTIYLPLTVQVIDSSISRPTIRLRDYLIYLKAGDRLNPRRYIQSVKDPMAEDQEAVIPPSAVSVNPNGLDLFTPGIYEVYYYYTGISQEVATVILTVIVT